MKTEFHHKNGSHEPVRVANSQEGKAVSEQLWMRSVSFSGLHRILHLIAAQTQGITAAELNIKIKEQKLYETRHKGTPALTTLYHCRNTLLKLNAITRKGRRLVANRESSHVEKLLSQSSTSGELNQISREAFAELVLQNRDCKRWFFDLFMLDNGAYSAHEFRSTGAPVLWRRSQNGPESTGVTTLKPQLVERAVRLRSPSEINAVLYGMRYWARDELRLIDEFYRENRGAVMYPILIQEDHTTNQHIIDELTALCGSDDDEWTTLSIQDLLETWGEKQRRPVASVFAAIRKLASSHSGQVVLIPTSRSFAALGAGFNTQRQELELRSYFRDSHGRYISHLRLHGSIRSLQHA